MTNNNTEYLYVKQDTYPSVVYNNKEFEINEHIRQVSITFDKCSDVGVGCLCLNARDKTPIQNSQFGLKYEISKQTFDNTNHGMMNKLRVKKDIGNIGIITGKANNITVVDFDWYNKDCNGKITGFKKNIDQLIQLHNDIILNTENPFIVETQSGGRHLYFKYTPLKNKSNALVFECDGVDVRSKGGYVCASGSLGKYGYYKHIAGCYKNIPTMNKNIQSYFKPETEPVKVKADKKDEYGTETEEYKTIVKDQYKKNCKDKYIKFILENIPSSYATDYSEWFKIINILGNILGPKSFDELAVLFSKRSENEAHTNRTDKEILKDCKRKVSTKKNYTNSNVLYSILWNKNRPKWEELQKLKMGDRIRNDKEFCPEFWKELKDYEPMKAYFEQHRVCVGGALNMIYDRKTMEELCNIDIWFRTMNNCKSYILKDEGTENEKVVFKPFKHIYMDEDNKRINFKDAQIYFGDTPRGCLNLFGGVYAQQLIANDEIKPNEEGGKLLMSLYYDILYTKEETEYILDLLARFIICPMERSGVMPVMWGAGGTGKSTSFMFIKRILTGSITEPHHSFAERKYGDMATGFIMSSVRGKLATLIEDIPEHGKSGVQEVFKDCIKQSVISATKKGEDTVSIRNYSQYWGVSNYPTCAIANKGRGGERSIMFVRVKDTYKENKPFWNKFYKQLMDDGSFKWFCMELSKRQNVCGRTQAEWERLIPPDPNEQLSIQIPSHAQVLRDFSKSHSHKGSRWYNKSKDLYYIDREYFWSLLGKCWKGQTKDKHSNQQKFMSEWEIFTTTNNFGEETRYFQSNEIKGKIYFIFNYTKLFGWLDKHKYNYPIKQNEYTTEEIEILKDLELELGECDIEDE